MSSPPARLPPPSPSRRGLGATGRLLDEASPACAGDRRDDRPARRPDRLLAGPRPGRHSRRDRDLGVELSQTSRRPRERRVPFRWHRGQLRQHAGPEVRRVGRRLGLAPPSRPAARAPASSRSTPASAASPCSSPTGRSSTTAEPSSPSGRHQDFELTKYTGHRTEERRRGGLGHAAGDGRRPRRPPHRPGIRELAGLRGTAVGAATTTAYAVKNGGVIAWGNNTYGQATPARVGVVGRGRGRRRGHPRPGAEERRLGGRLGQQRLTARPTSPRRQAPASIAISAAR